MTREQARRVVSVILGYAQGKTVQDHRDGWWKDNENPDFEHGEWRIKPEEPDATLTKS